MLSRLIRPGSVVGRLVASLTIGLGLPVILLGILLVHSHGNEPLGMCERVQGHGGTLPIDMSRGGDVAYTCGLNWDYVALNVGLPGLGFAVLAYIFIGLLKRAESN